MKKLMIPYAFVDGSYNPTTKVYGYGGFLVYKNNGKEIKVEIQGVGDDPDMATMRNVAGEICGAVAAIKKAMELKLPKITIYYDYLGIEMWATGLWKRNKKGTKAYYEFIKEASSSIDIEFIHVKGHSGIEGNETADIMAKKAVGVYDVYDERRKQYEKCLGCDYHYSEINQCMYGEENVPSNLIQKCKKVG